MELLKQVEFQPKRMVGNMKESFLVRVSRISKEYLSRDLKVTEIRIYKR